MSIEMVRSLLVWCCIINYGILVIWFVVFVSAHDSLYGLHKTWFKISPRQFDTAHYAGMTIYKIGIMLLNLVPLIALWILT